MGNYNDHVPQILGQEWVDIRDELITLSPASRAVERGQGFTLATSRTLQDARFYINDWSPTAALGETLLMAIYPQGQEAASGPIKKVIIPCSSGGVTGGSGPVGLGGGALTFADGVADPSDGKYVNSYVGGSTGSPVTATVEAFFATNAYSAQLTGKRILSVNLLYSIATEVGRFADQGGIVSWSVETNSGGIAAFYGASSVGTLPMTDTVSVYGKDVFRMPLGEIDVLWDTTLTTLTTSERLPYNYTSLQRFDPASTNRRAFRFRSGSTPTAFQTAFHYLALEIFYCEEQRVALGGRAFGSDIFASLPSGYRPYTLNTNILTMRTIAQVLNPVLIAGNYTTVLSSADVGVLFGPSAPVKNATYPPMNALRELYAIPAHPGYQINIPFPLSDQVLGKTFTKETSHVVPQLSLHTSGGPLTEVQVYGRQAVAQVYGTITATQEILDSVMPAAEPFPWVRFYARRFSDTTVPLRLSSLSPSVSGLCTAVQITPQEWDALDEIVDGWKEITLRFPCIPTMGSGANPQWIFSAAGETVGDRWEVLGARAPALSGVPGNILTSLVPSPNQLSTATYGAPSFGSTTINLGWLSETVTVTTDDITADAVLLFAQDMPTITGFTVVGLAQAVSGIGQACGINPCCIPSAIGYNQLSWSLPVNTAYGLDGFTRTVAGGLGSADVGGAYVIPVPADFSVDGEQALVAPSAANSRRFATLAMGSDFDITIDTGVTNAVVATSAANGGIVGRFTDIDNYYLARIRTDSAGVMDILLDKRVATVTSNVITVNDIQGIANGAGAMVSLRFVGEGTFLKVKIWPAGTVEPTPWLIETTDTSLTTGTRAGLYAINDTATGNTISFDNLLITPPRVNFGTYELQRMDTVEPDWQTIMAASTPQTSTFNDYEARVGIATSYRIRATDVYDFPGPWSSTVTITSAAPGVTGGCVSDGHVLIFTTNERQNGSSNLAYASVWEGRVEENFTFPEAGFVQLQAMYNRDFFTAFRPLERGGEQFSRTVLVQAAAIAPETLADFTSLRSMAWDTVPYICVRDEDGNRWFATVIVPTGRVLRDRRLYLAAVNITEVTATPSLVDP